MEHAGPKVYYWNTPECPLWKAKMHLSISKRSTSVSAVYLSIRVFAFYSAAETLASKSVVYIFQPVYTLRSLVNGTILLNSAFFVPRFQSLEVEFLTRFVPSFPFLRFRRPHWVYRVAQNSKPLPIYQQINATANQKFNLLLTGQDIKA